MEEVGEGDSSPPPPRERADESQIDRMLETECRVMVDGYPVAVDSNFKPVLALVTDGIVEREDVLEGIRAALQKGLPCSFLGRIRKLDPPRRQGSDRDQSPSARNRNRASGRRSCGTTVKRSNASQAPDDCGRGDALSGDSP